MNWDNLILFLYIQIDNLSSVRLIIAKDLLPLENRENTLKKVSEVLSRFSKQGMPLLDPEEDMKVSFFTIHFFAVFCSYMSNWSYVHLNTLNRSKVDHIGRQFAGLRP